MIDLCKCCVHGFCICLFAKQRLQIQDLCFQICDRLLCRAHSLFKSRELRLQGGNALVYGSNACRQLCILVAKSGKRLLQSCDGCVHCFDCCCVCLDTAQIDRLDCRIKLLNACVDCVKAGNLDLFKRCKSCVDLRNFFCDLTCICLGCNQRIQRVDRLPQISDCLLIGSHSLCKCREIGLQGCKACVGLLDCSCQLAILFAKGCKRLLHVRYGCAQTCNIVLIGRDLCKVNTFQLCIDGCNCRFKCCNCLVYCAQVNLGGLHALQRVQSLLYCLHCLVDICNACLARGNCIAKLVNRLLKVCDPVCHVDNRDKHGLTHCGVVLSVHVRHHDSDVNLIANRCGRSELIAGNCVPLDRIVQLANVVFIRDVCDLLTAVRVDCGVIQRDVLANAYPIGHDDGHVLGKNRFGCKMNVLKCDGGNFIGIGIVGGKDHLVPACLVLRDRTERTGNSGILRSAQQEHLTAYVCRRAVSTKRMRCIGAVIHVKLSLGDGIGCGQGIRAVYRVHKSHIGQLDLKLVLTDIND